MPGHINYNDTGYAQSAAEILRQHDNAEPEANITSTMRGLLVTTRPLQPRIQAIRCSRYG